MFVILGIFILLASFVIALVSLIREQRKFGENQPLSQEDINADLGQGILRDEVPASLGLEGEIVDRNLELQLLQDKIDALKAKNSQEDKAKTAGKNELREEEKHDIEDIVQLTRESDDLRFPWDENSSSGLKTEEQIQVSALPQSGLNPEELAQVTIDHKKPQKGLSRGGQFSVADLVKENNNQ